MLEYYVYIISKNNQRNNKCLQSTFVQEPCGIRVDLTVSILQMEKTDL